jgi:thymidylate synthase
MEIIYSRNVNDAYKQGLERLINSGERQNSRAGPVISMTTPVVNVYNNPWERVLFNPLRDANPFFHIVEAVWMIAGWNDATVLDEFVSDFSKRFAEDDGLAHGAYGYRWRTHFAADEHGTGYLDQLQEAGRLLRENPESRQVVVAMWDPSVDLGATKRDLPCNDLVMFRAQRNGLVAARPEWRLDMSIVARSHDAVWGAYGANAVHMSVMHEVVAGLANMSIGTYTHFSNNFHVYEAVLPKVSTRPEHNLNPYGKTVTAKRICRDQSEAETFIAESEQLMRELKVHQMQTASSISLWTEPETPWLRDTVIPMIHAHRAYKLGEFEAALTHACDVGSTDWGTAAEQWLQRRQAKKAGATP